MTQARHKFIIVDDSPAMQQLFGLLLSQAPDIEIMGAAATAETGWSMFCRTLPDVVILDLELPDRPGMDLLRRIMKERPTPVVIVSANGGEGSLATIAALSAGAVAFIDKPNTVDMSIEVFRETLLKTLRMAAEVRAPLARMVPGLERQPRPPDTQARELQRDRVLAIGASTGGVAAIQNVLTGLGALQLPILVTQHMPAGYTRRFAERLQQVTQFTVKEAENGDALSPGCVLVAPGDRHLSLVGSGAGARVKLDDGPTVMGHKPSVDVMFKAVAEQFGRKAIGILLTGMGRDGAEGLLAIHKAGAPTAVESEETAVVFGMPKAALELGAADVRLALDAVPAWIQRAAALPTAAAAPAARPQTAPAAAKDLRTKPIPSFRVLVVDDQKSMRGLASHALKQLGFSSVDEADSGETALAAIQTTDYDLLLADWNMEGMTGLDLLRAVRKSRNQRQIAIVMTTSESHISKVSEAMAAGANNYLVKPCDAPKLRQRLERALMRQIALA